MINLSRPQTRIIEFNTSSCRIFKSTFISCIYRTLKLIPFILVILDIPVVLHVGSLLQRGPLVVGLMSLACTREQEEGVLTGQDASWITGASPHEEALGDVLTDIGGSPVVPPQLPAPPVSRRDRKPLLLPARVTRAAFSKKVFNRVQRTLDSLLAVLEVLAVRDLDLDRTGGLGHLLKGEFTGGGDPDLLFDRGGGDTNNGGELTMVGPGHNGLPDQDKIKWGAHDAILKNWF